MNKKPILVIDAHTRHQQELASNPNHSAWVSANAGSGKTTVLSRRVVRLLLAGTNPARILCLTFTKAAAGEMSNRVFSILGNWATLSENKLIKELTDIQGKAPAKGQIKRARTLFARALETPGGLKIQTIHAFCEALLHQFPLEANIPGTFTVVDDATQSQLMDEARRSVILEVDASPDSSLAHAFSLMMAHATDHAIEKTIKEVIQNRDGIADWLSEVGGPAKAEAQTRAQFHFAPNDTSESLLDASMSDSCFNDIDFDLLITVADTVDQKGAKDISRLIQHFRNAKGSIEMRQIAQELVFTKSGKPRAFTSYPSKPLEEGYPGLREIFAREAERLISSSQRINTLIQIEQTTPLLVVAEAIINHYRQLKRSRGLLDFDDLIAKTVDLLTRKTARTWVLYKLDLGIDHILLDEAQDTSPQQWKIIDALVEEFFSGQSARLLNRTIFAVGDEKQSIYSFQGAEPASFAHQRKAYEKLVRDSGKEFEPVNLNLSFRSTQDVLSAVDTVFDNSANANGVSFDGKADPHIAARKGAPGQVDVWPLEKPDDLESPINWHTPQESFETSHQAIKLAGKIARQIGEWIGHERIEATQNIVNAGDIIVLVRARDRFMVALNRALKDLGVSVAGADRLVLTDHIAVQDLLALGQVMLCPEDDLAVAGLLKSPLVGLSENQLHHLARARFHDGYESSLFEALRDSKSDETFTLAYQMLSSWRLSAGHLPVYEFYARILGADNGRKKFYGRLGQEAEDVLDAFLTAALDHEQKGLPGLRSFLETLSRQAPVIKREMDQSSNQVRVMTVHAAKGLEAPIVFLVDKCSAAFQGTHAPSLYEWSDDTTKGYLWTPRTNLHGDKTLELKSEIKHKAEQEYRRLLYVGMTRAKDRLILCGYHGGKKPPEPNWHNMVQEALTATSVQILSDCGEVAMETWRQPENQRHAGGIAEDSDDKIPSDGPNQLPSWIYDQLPRETALPRPLNPSGAQALIEESAMIDAITPSLLDRGKDDGIAQKETGGFARQRGTALHMLLQILPELPHSSQSDNRWRAAGTYLQKMLPDIDSDERSELIDTVRRVFETPELKACFDRETSRAEVPIMGQIELITGSRTVSGTIDRLAVLDDQVIALDYKTSAHVPRCLDEVSPDYFSQMALYRCLVTKLYPQKPVNAVLVWTHGPKGPVVMPLPSDRMDAALAKIAVL